MHADLAPTQLIGAPAPWTSAAWGACVCVCKRERVCVCARVSVCVVFFFLVFFFSSLPRRRPARLNDGEDKKRDDIDGERSAQSRRREEARRHAWKFSAGGPGKLSAQRTAQPENNFGFPPWKSWGHPDERQIRN